MNCKSPKAELFDWLEYEKENHYQACEFLENTFLKQEEPTVLDLLVCLGWATSKNEARKLIRGSGIHFYNNLNFIDEESISEKFVIPREFLLNGFSIKKGKKSFFKWAALLDVVGVTEKIEGEYLSFKLFDWITQPKINKEAGLISYLTYEPGSCKVMVERYGRGILK